MKLPIQAGAHHVVQPCEVVARTAAEVTIAAGAWLYGVRLRELRRHVRQNVILLGGGSERARN